MEMYDKDIDVNKVKNILRDLDVDFMDGSIVRDNKLYFTHDDKSYRVCMPSTKDLADAEQKKLQTYGKLLVTEGYYLRKNLIKILKESQDIDIKSLEENREKILADLKDAYIDLAEAGKSENQDYISKRRKQVVDIKNKLIDVDTEITIYLSPCIEDQADKKHIEYLTFLKTQTLVKDSHEEFERVWNKYEEFENDDTQLAVKAINRLTKLVLDARDIL